MKTSRKAPPVHSEILAALKGLEATLQGASAAPELLLVPLTRIGDAMRAELDLPQELRTWLRVVPDQDLGAALDAQREEVSEWRVPARVSADDQSFAFTLRRRDEAESVRLAAARSALARRVVPGAVHGFAELGQALIDFDHKLAPVVTRSQVEVMLGMRAALQDSRGWTSRLTDPVKEETVARLSDLELPVDQMTSEPLSDETVLAWIAEGRLAKLVEGRASTDPALRDELLGVIDTLRKQGEQVGLAARRWERKQQQQQHGSDPRRASIEYMVRPHASLAAAGVASEEAAVSRTDTELGMLSPLRARARLLCTAHHATLKVYADPGSIRTVRFGAAETSSPDASGVWVVQIPIEDAPVDLHVVSTSGEEFLTTLVIVDIPAGEES